MDQPETKPPTEEDKDKKIAFLEKEINSLMAMCASMDASLRKLSLRIDGLCFANDLEDPLNDSD